jgi:hypothetical protein
MNSHRIAKLIDTSETLERLENDFWGNPPAGASNLVVACHKLRQKKIQDFDAGDFRLLIGQQIGLPFLIPLAIEILDVNTFVEGDYYEGDLLKSVLTSEIEFWKNNSQLKDDVVAIFEKSKDGLDQMVSPEVKDQLIEAYSRFLSA